MYSSHSQLPFTPPVHTLRLLSYAFTIHAYQAHTPCTPTTHTPRAHTPCRFHASAEVTKRITHSIEGVGGGAARVLARGGGAAAQSTRLLGKLAGGWEEREEQLPTSQRIQGRRGASWSKRLVIAM